MCDSGAFSGEIMLMFLVGQMPELVENSNIGIFFNTTYVKKKKKSNFAWWYHTFSFTCFLHFRWPWHYLKVTEMPNGFTRNIYVFIWLSLNFVGLLSTSSRLWKYHYFWLSFIFEGNNCHVSSINNNNNKNTLSLAFFQGHCLIKAFQSWHYYKLAWGLPNHTRFDDHAFFKVTDVLEL